MSFSYDVKKELCFLINDKERKYACFYGMLLFCKKFSINSIVLQTENDLIAELFCNLANDILNETEVVRITASEKKDKTRVYHLSINDRRHRNNIFFRYHISEHLIVPRIQTDNIGNNGLFSFLSGVFLSCGSITEPIKEYHLEFVISYKELMFDLLRILQNLNINAKTTERKGYNIIYMKESTAIEDLLTLMGATMSSIELMNTKIYKDVRNKANRIANCDSANIERTINASEKQIKDIEYIINTVGIDQLPPELINVAEIRLEYPEMSLRELGEALDTPIGRSGINHRLKKISEIASRLHDEKHNSNNK